ncbi:MAG: 50S ribosomal protein L10 [Armatimonadota bacterium]
MPKQKNVDDVLELKQDVDQSSAMLVTDYRGLTVSEITALRRKLRETGTEYKVAKNTLLTLAAGEKATEEFKKLLEGPTAVAFIKGDNQVAAAKAMVDFVKDHKAMSIRGALVEGQVLNVEQVTALSKIPSKEILISQMLGSIQAPISGLVGTLQGCISSLVFTIQAVADQKSA